MLRKVMIALTMLFWLNAEAQTFHLVTEPFPPLNMTVLYSSFGRNEKVTGFATDIVRETFKRAGLRLELTLYASWDRALNMALNEPGKGIYSAFRTAERENKFKWVGPLFEEEWIILARKSRNITINQLADLNKYAVGSFEADAITDYLLEKKINVIKAKNDVVNAMKLKIDKIDLWATSSLSGPFIAQRQKMDDIERIFTFSKSGLWLAMNKSTSDETIELLNSALSTLRNEGRIEAIIDKYREK
ncbi:substrate-binding periplasmic protein [Zooshikella ganghwensis]|uniref:substrate-binding periplasmic protein n=1 Tax=Zooshikella ganghwensis TaxID=202772 RepID=UPI0003F8B871|nr:transporter substrate-binding domain-containing protein [Zooshikella ganghwensis]